VGSETGLGNIKLQRAADKQLNGGRHHGPFNTALASRSSYPDYHTDRSVLASLEGEVFTGQSPKVDQYTEREGPAAGSLQLRLRCRWIVGTRSRARCSVLVVRPHRKRVERGAYAHQRAFPWNQRGRGLKA
jgi:hypothetical protein